MAWKPKRLLWLETVVKANEFVNHDRHRRQSSCIFTATSTDIGPLAGVKRLANVFS